MHRVIGVLPKDGCVDARVIDQVTDQSWLGMQGCGRYIDFRDLGRGKAYLECIYFIEEAD